MIDWVEIKNEYISTQISTRKLAEKHGVSYQTLRDKAKREKWVLQRSKIGAKSEQKTAEAISTEQSNRIVSLMSACCKVSDLLNIRLDQMISDEKIKTYELKAITEALKNIRDLYETDTTPDGDEDSDGLMEALNATASDVCSGDDDSYLLPGGGCDGEEESS